MVDSMLPNTVKRAVILKLELVNTQVFHLTNALNQKNQQPLKTICWYVTNQFLLKTLTLFRMGFFGAAHGWSSPPPPKKNLSHISYNDETWHSYTSYTLPKNDPKNIWITWHTPWVPLTSAIFHWKSANFAISRNTCIDCILIQNF